MSENMKNILFIMIIAVVMVLVTFGGYNSGKREKNEDLDDIDDDFILYMIKEHPDVYIYFMEREETSSMTGELTSLEYTIPKEIRKHYIYEGIQRLLWKELIWLEIN